jgi:hypothetical protein
MRSPYAEMMRREPSVEPSSTTVHGVRTHWYHPRYTIWYLADHASTVRVPFLRLFNLAERHTLLCDDKPVQSFPPQLTDRQRQTLDQLGIPERAFLA